MRERAEDRKEMRAKSKELDEARQEIRNVIQANEEERLGRARAEEMAAQMHHDFHAYRADVIAGRPPKDTPPSFARFDETQPYGLQKAAT